nr:MAG: hypothetical protein [Lake Baikal virophage 16]
MNKKKYLGYGIRPSDKEFFKITKTQYEAQPEPKLGEYDLVLNTPTVKAYADLKAKTIVLSIRGTTDGRDVGADTMIPFNRLKYSNRYTEDRNIIASLINQYNPEEFDYYGTGHSLGSALLRQLQREFPFIKDTVTFNGAVQPYDIVDQKANLNKSYYTEDDALYKLGGRLLTNKIVLPSTENVVKLGALKPIVPTSAKIGTFVYNAAQGHKLDNFEGVLGGAISRMREKLQKMTVKEIKEAVKNELNGAIKGYTKMKKEELIDAIRDYQKKKGSKKSEEPKLKEVKKIGKREQFLLDEREKKVIFVSEQLIDRLPDIYKSISELVEFKKIKNKCKKLYAKSKNMLLRIEDDKPTIELFDEKNDKIKNKYGVGCPKNRRGINLTGANDIFKQKLSYINNLINEFSHLFIDRGYTLMPYYYLNWYRNKYPEEEKKLSIKYVKDGMGWTDNFRFTNEELEQINKGIEIGTKGLFNKVPDFEKLKDELNILEKEILYSGDDFDYYRNYKAKEPKITPKKLEEPKITPKKSEEPKIKVNNLIKILDKVNLDLMIKFIKQEEKTEFKKLSDEEIIKKINKELEEEEIRYYNLTFDSGNSNIGRPEYGKGAFQFNKIYERLLNNEKDVIDDFNDFIYRKYFRILKNSYSLFKPNLNLKLKVESPPLLLSKKKKSSGAILGSGSCCMCHIKDVVRGGAIEERQIKTLDDFKTIELRKIASIFNKFFKIKLTKLTRNEIIKELSKYIYLNESGSIFVNEDEMPFFSLKPKDVLKEIETKKLQNKIKKEAKPKTRREILQKEKIGVLKALLISLGGETNLKGLKKINIIDRIKAIEFKTRKNELKEPKIILNQKEEFEKNENIKKLDEVKMTKEEEELNNMSFKQLKELAKSYGTDATQIGMRKEYPPLRNWRKMEKNELIKNIIKYRIFKIEEELRWAEADKIRKENKRQEEELIKQQEKKESLINQKIQREDNIDSLIYSIKETNKKLKNDNQKLLIVPKKNELESLTNDEINNLYANHLNFMKNYNKNRKK